MNTPDPTPPSPSSGPVSTCPRCRRPIPEDAVGGTCPACLLAAGFFTRTAAPASDLDEPPPPIAELAPEFPALELLELLGRGGMGAVYKARQRDLDRFVALKILRPGLDADPSFAARFTEEARALARLNHPGIVTLHEFGRSPAGRYFIVMEFVDGMNLRQLLAVGRVSAREALAIVPPLCDALQYAHDRALVHRDIKPENILVDRLGRVKIADFGLAKLIQSERSAGIDTPSTIGHWSCQTSASNALEDIGHSAESGVLGTPAYMAPEQRTRPFAVDHRADIYALGVVLYQMLTGELPAPGELQPPSRRVQIDVRLDEIVLRALETDPSRRYAAAGQLKTEVETLAASRPCSAPDAAAAEHASRVPSARLPWIGFGLLVLAYAVVVLATAHHLPERVASHFSANGRADGWMPRAAYLRFALVFPWSLGAFFALIAWVLPKLPAGFYNLPRRDHWLAPKQRPATDAILGRWMSAPPCLLLLFFGQLHLSIISANRLSPPRLETGLVLGPVIGLLLALMIWAVGLVLRFAEPEATPAKLRRQAIGLAAAAVIALLSAAILSREAWRELSGPGAPKSAASSPGPVVAAPISVSVQGSVARPGTYSLRPDATLIDAIAAAGGWVAQGDQSAILVTPPGADRPEVHDLGAILHGEAVNPGLAAGATVFVPTRNR